MTTGTQIMNRAAVLLNDATFTRWRCSELCEWINEAVRAIVLAKPSACSKTVTLRLVTGSRQSINPQVPVPGVPVKTGSVYTFNTGVYPLTLIAVIRNFRAIIVNPDGKPVTPANPIQTGAKWVADRPGRMIKLVNRALLEAQVPDWHDPTVTQNKQEVRNYTFDETVPYEFYVYPPNDGSGFVEAEVGTLPVPLVATLPANNTAGLKLTDNTPVLYPGDLGLPEPYSVPLLDYVLYRCQMKDDIDGAAGRSAIHYQQFATAIGLKIQVEKAHTPNARRE